MGTEKGSGWVFLNVDTGEEYAPNHPVRSGEVPDAQNIRRSTPQEDVLWRAFQSEFERAHSLEIKLASQSLADGRVWVLREPTMEMILAGSKVICAEMPEDYFAAKGAWSAMIAACESDDGSQGIAQGQQP